MKTVVSFLIAVLLSLKINAQDESLNFKMITINKQVKDFPDQFDLSSPLNSFVTLKYIYANGKNRLLRSVNSIKNKSIFPDSTVQDSQPADDARNRHLNIKIKEVITYRDSVAFVLSEDEDDEGKYYSIRSFSIETGKWVTGGEDGRRDIDEARQFILDRAWLFFENFKLIQKNFFSH